MKAGEGDLQTAGPAAPIGEVGVAQAFGDDLFLLLLAGTGVAGVEEFLGALDGADALEAGVLLGGAGGALGQMRAQVAERGELLGAEGLRVTGGSCPVKWCSGRLPTVMRWVVVGREPARQGRAG
ncbi:hypothetical protein, partial [Kitasatospora aureofaciens]